MADDNPDDSNSEGNAPETSQRNTEPQRLPDDHPLVTAYQRVKQEAVDAQRKVKDFEDRGKTESQRLTDQLSEARAEAQKAEAKALGYQVAVKYGLTEDDLDVLDMSGSAEDVEKRAKRLAERLKGAPVAPASDRQGGQSGGPTGNDMNSQIRRAAGRR